MDFVQILLILSAVAGGIMVIISFTGSKEKKELDIQEDMHAPKAYVLDKKLEVMDSTLSEADDVITELGGMSQNVLKEMDNRYNELLFLYNLIDEKEKGISDKAEETSEAEDERQDAPSGQIAFAKPESSKPAPVRKNAYSNPKLTEIMELKGQGLNVPQIAKELNMGQGEVSLILSLKQM